MTTTREKGDWLDSDNIKANLKTSRIGREVVVFDSTTSTNDIAAEYAQSKENDGLVVFAEEQSAGRGRGGNKWFSRKGESILCSIALTQCKLNPELLSLAGAVAVAEAIGKVGAAETKVKWPNDIVVGGRKIAGILVESKQTTFGTSFIIGIGLNCHQSEESFDGELRDIATSMDIESKTVCDRITVVKRLLMSVEQWLGRAEKNSKKVISKWRKLSIQLGHRVRLSYNGRQFCGNCIGIDPEKGLILQLDGGGVRMFDASHTSIGR